MYRVREFSLTRIIFFDTLAYLEKSHMLSFFKKHAKILWISFAVLALGFLAFVILGYLAIMRGSLQGAQYDKSQAQRIVEDTWEAEKNTGDWKTYTNKEFGFEVKLPPGCELKETRYNSGEVHFGMTSSCFDSGKENAGIGFSFFPTVTNEGTQNPCGVESRITLISNNPLSEAKLCYQNLKWGFTTYDYAFVRNGKGYILATSHLDKTYNIRIEKAILNSFRFID